LWNAVRRHSQHESPLAKQIDFHQVDTRVEQITNYDRLLLEVETNGAVTPQEAVVHASDRLGELVALFRELVEGPAEPSETPAPSPGIDDERPIEQLDLSVRALNCLKREGIHTLGDLLECTIEDLMDIRNFGEKSVDEVRDKLEEMGFQLKTREL
jgi:DNA-directed RNA polymerase subunit alpha